MIGNDGLTAAVKKETDAALNAHGLIKVRVFWATTASSAKRIYQQLADELGAAPIQHIGKLLVLWRPKPKKEKAEDEEPQAGPPRIQGHQELQPRAASARRSRRCASWATSG